MLKRKAARRSSAQYYVTAEEHVENEVKHEKLLTETSRLSSSWAGLSISCLESVERECSLSSASGSSSPSQRPNSFSGPLLISVTCSNAQCNSAGTCGLPNASCGNKCTPSSPPQISRSSSCCASPAASPVSSRVQSYSPGFANSNNSPNPRRYSNNGGTSPLIFSTALGRKRGYLACTSGNCGFSSDASREGSPEFFFGHRGNKSLRQTDSRTSNINSDFPYFRWPPNLPTVSSPSSPSCQLFSSATSLNTPSSASSSNLSSPQVPNSTVTPIPVSLASANLVDCSAPSNNPSLDSTIKKPDKELVASVMDLDVKSYSSVTDNIHSDDTCRNGYIDLVPVDQDL